MKPYDQISNDELELTFLGSVDSEEEQSSKIQFGFKDLKTGLDVQFDFSLNYYSSYFDFAGACRHFDGDGCA